MYPCIDDGMAIFDCIVMLPRALAEADVTAVLVERGFSQCRHHHPCSAGTVTSPPATHCQR
jgi:hypothetical protein